MRRAPSSTGALLLAVALVSLVPLVSLGTLGCAVQPRGDRPPEAPAPAGERTVETPLGPLELLGEAVVRPETWQGAPVGGLSALRYHPESDRFLALSDDRADYGHIRFYHLEVVMEGASEDGVRAEVRGVTLVRDEDGRPILAGALDPEALELVPGELVSSEPAGAVLYLASEGHAVEGRAPQVFRIEPHQPPGAPTLAPGPWPEMKVTAELPVPEAYHPVPERRAGSDVVVTRGVRDNQAFESLALTPGGRRLVTATEGPLVQDGPEPTARRGAPVRLLVWDLAAPGGPRPVAEHLYPLEPVARAPLLPGLFSRNGLVELLALDEHRFLALERSFTAGRGNRVRLFEIDLREASNLLDKSLLAAGALDALPPEERRPVAKRLVLDLVALEHLLHHPVDNLEGLTFGPDLPDGRRTLLLLADDNFGADQVSQLIVLAVGEPRGARASR